MTEAIKRAEQVVFGMLAKDEFSRWLGIEVTELRPAFCICRMTVRDEMVNGFGVAHGGIVFSLADSAFAFACNSRNEAAVAAACHIDYLEPSHEGDVLLAEAVEQALAGRAGVYDISITNQAGRTVALFRGKSIQLKRSVTPA